MVMRELRCRYCNWQSEGYSEDMVKALNEAKEHAKKNHKIPWKHWSNEGKVTLEMFKVVETD